MLAPNNSQVDVDGSNCRHPRVIWSWKVCAWIQTSPIIRLLVEVSVGAKRWRPFKNRGSPLETVVAHAHLEDYRLSGDHFRMWLECYLPLSGNVSELDPF